MLDLRGSLSVKRGYCFPSKRVTLAIKGGYRIKFVDFVGVHPPMFPSKEGPLLHRGPVSSNTMPERNKGCAYSAWAAGVMAARQT